MHKSQWAGFIIDCETEDLEAATEFWAEALGLEADIETQRQWYEENKDKPLF